MAHTLGSKTLNDICSPEVTRESVAAACKVTVAAVGHWCTGRGKPSDANRMILWKLFGIPLDSWHSALPETPEASDAA